MYLTQFQTFSIILSVALGAMITRFLPFIFFPENKEPPQIVHYLGRVLPPSMMGLLVVYCLKNVTVLQAPFGLPELASIFLIVILQKWKRNVLLSIGGGTVLYMFIINYFGI
ncbi:branched-chain amino acid transporter permease [Anaerotignum sp. MB30-C6]|uniref:branched-chain amino acid transporter permease n=1 Tax=Anaerotignum sp. MB30-C6 TaxID=3070814 RepID=UPI0027DCBB49|nr:branched-chain amino acid transporter permease [Anaerotignum sp. MB30-C6]WMI81240.1 branched-chain amino acid transporter permease [Anaerotignum sp. MB30-C6]